MIKCDMSSFDSVARLERAISRWLAHWNENAMPFRWRDLQRYCINTENSVCLSDFIDFSNPYR